MSLEKALQTQGFKSQRHKAMLNLLYTTYQVRSAVEKALKAYALTPEQFNVLRILKGKHPELMCVRDIAGRMLERSSNVPRIIDRLVAKKLVKRSTSQVDKRETVIQITEAGINMLAVVNPVVDRLHEQLCHLSEDEAATLNTLLDGFRGE